MGNTLAPQRKCICIDVFDLYPRPPRSYDTSLLESIKELTCHKDGKLGNCSEGKDKASARKELQSQRSMTKIALKIDIDTLIWLKEGVPRLAGLLDRYDIKASFFIAFGPDSSGKALFRIFRHKGFLEKMFRIPPGTVLRYPHPFVRNPAAVSNYSQ